MNFCLHFKIDSRSNRIKAKLDFLEVLASFYFIFFFFSFWSSQSHFTSLQRFSCLCGSKLCGGRDQESFIQVMAYCLIKSLAKWSKKKQLRGSMRSKFSFFIFFFFFAFFFLPIGSMKKLQFWLFEENIIN